MSKTRLQVLKHVRCHRFQQPTTLRLLFPDQDKNEAFVYLLKVQEHSALRQGEPGQSSQSGKQECIVAIQLAGQTCSQICSISDEFRIIEVAWG
jgi:hypothetical protein